MLGSFYAKLAEVNKKFKKMVEVYVYTSDYARTGDYNILKICAHIRSSDLQHRVFIWNFNYYQKKKHLAGYLNLPLVIEKIDLS